MKMWRAGLDAGATKTELLVLDPEDRLVFAAEAPGSSLSLLSAQEVLARWEDLLERAQAALGRIPDRLAVGAAGASDPTLQRTLRYALEARFPGLDVRIGHDGLIAHLGALGGQPGLLVLCGTGSLVLGRSGQNAWIRAGGWGYLLGDEAGAYRIGLEALRRLARALDDPKRHTELTRALMQHWGVRDRADLIRILYRSGRSPAELAPWIADRLLAGDVQARRLVEAQLRALAQQARLVAQALDRSARQISYSGGLTHLPAFREALVRTLAQALPGWPIFPPRNRPALGAALYADEVPKP
ncbi:MAG: hypothetical protein N2561_02010 [Bacteroidetes bacterium]|nr:hypothetical protein [Rhodothermia bacterium]MCS7154579.1 hypothetical protein [Bacteroidota bacterium]MCX7906296.1 hypothetical protein [Bacteroidota bacterium]MDW8137372.1 BadF/BadG/BcrA/BcrD ATPase family protein [Bacteroidota bacterium]MDW8285674.1 BadF/BadG/BcrA/BcrD ATPase family protein [Bacteroidota bacterium]